MRTFIVSGPSVYLDFRKRMFVCGNTNAYLCINRRFSIRSCVNLGLLIPSNLLEKLLGFNQACAYLTFFCAYFGYVYLLKWNTQRKYYEYLYIS